MLKKNTKLLDKNQERGRIESMLKYKAEQGITLVALVITIIIIIILATVAINFAFGNNGLITRAEQARDFYANDTKYTEESMSNVESYLEGMLPGGSGNGGDEPVTPPTPTVPGTVADAIPEEGEEIYIFEETTQIKDASDDNMWVPEGFGIASDSATDIDDGVVITNTDNTKQFVWIPVDATSLNEMYQSASGTKLTGIDTTTNVYSKLRIRSGDSYTAGAPNSTNVREPDVLSSYDTDSEYYTILDSNYTSTKDMADDMVEEYWATYNSIQKYGGFYIGRYELTGSVASPTVQKKQPVLTNQNWYNLKKACTNVVTGEEYGAQSTMIYGNQWDEVMDWLVDTGDKTSSQVNTDSSSWGNYINYNTTNGYNEGDIEYDATAGTPKPSGINPGWRANNIYDLAGNYWEWTQEAIFTYRRTTRGGGWSGTGLERPATIRFNNDPYDIPAGVSSRATLYIK